MTPKTPESSPEIEPAANVVGSRPPLRPIDIGSIVDRVMVIEQNNNAAQDVAPTASESVRRFSRSDTEIASLNLARVKDFIDSHGPRHRGGGKK